MLIVNRVNDLISGSFNGQQFGVSFDQTKYDLMLALQDRADAATTVEEMQDIIKEFEPLTKESYKELVETMCPYILVNRHSNKFYLQFNGKVSSYELPQGFVDRILKSVEKNINVTPLIKCWVRFLRDVPGRPKYTKARGELFDQYINAPYVNSDKVQKLMNDEGLSNKMATELSTTTQVAITQEGLLVCYKVSAEVRERYELNADEEVIQKSRYKKNVDPDTGFVTYSEPTAVEDRLFKPYVMKDRGDEFYCGDKKGHFIRVGQRHWLESWDQVSSPGSKGLHCGGLNYIRGYQNGEDAVTHNIFVDPANIHTIAGVGYGNDGAMTVKEYFVFSSFAGPNKSIYHSSTYAAITDAEYAKMVQEIVEQTKMKQEEAQKLMETTQAFGAPITKATTSTGSTESGSKLNIDDALKG